jgi:serine/threonine protein kinase
MRYFNIKRASCLAAANACSVRDVRSVLFHDELVTRPQMTLLMLQYDDGAFESLEAALLVGAVEAKIADFGMAMHLTPERSHASGVHCGTAFYMAPEIEQEQKFHPASDVYAFGVMMWELMMGCLVYYPRCGALCCAVLRVMWGCCLGDFVCCQTETFEKLSVKGPAAAAAAFPFIAVVGLVGLFLLVFSSALIASDW